MSGNYICVEVNQTALLDFHKTAPEQRLKNVKKSFQECLKVRPTHYFSCLGRERKMREARKGVREGRRLSEAPVQYHAVSYLLKTPAACIKISWTLSESSSESSRPILLALEEMPSNTVLFPFVSDEATFFRYRSFTRYARFTCLTTDQHERGRALSEDLRALTDDHGHSRGHSKSCRRPCSFSLGPRLLEAEGEVSRQTLNGFSLASKPQRILKSPGYPPIRILESSTTITRCLLLSSHWLMLQRSKVIVSAPCPASS